MVQRAIQVQQLSKRFYIGSQQLAYYTMRDQLTDMFLGPLRRTARLLRGQSTAASDLQEELWALRDISFDVNHGEVIGIVGRNGAGKSVLLKTLAEITEPTEGEIRLWGRVGALLEVGTGFHQELTGRENIYLNGAILGMNRLEINRKFDEIVAFSEVERFIDTPVKHYSSGMQMRLGFAVAAHLEPDIMIVDEVLAVGDAAFQKKCLGKMTDVSGEGRTVLFVSHNMNSVEMLCSRVIWIEQGKIIKDGPSSEVISAYLMAVAEGTLFNKSNEKVQIKRVVLKDESGTPTHEFQPGSTLDMGVYMNVTRRIENPSVLVIIEGKYGPVYGANMLIDGHNPIAIEGETFIGIRFKNLPLLPQFYTVTVGIRDDAGDYYLKQQEVTAFSVTGALQDYGLKGKNAELISRFSLPLVLPYEWYDEQNNIYPVDYKSQIHSR